MFEIEHCNCSFTLTLNTTTYNDIQNHFWNFTILGSVLRGTKKAFGVEKMIVAFKKSQNVQYILKSEQLKYLATISFESD